MKIINFCLFFFFFLFYGVTHATFYINEDTVTITGSTYELISTDVTYNESVVIETGYSLIVDKQLTINGDLYIQSGAVLTHSTSSNTDSHIIVNGKLMIDSGGKIDMSQKGINSKGRGNNGGGGSYGGYGGNKTNEPYGDIYNPMEVGSYGYSAFYKGGGLVRLTVDRLENNGAILSNAQNSSRYGKGSGGGINIVVNGEYSGSGLIEANGGTGGSNSQNGGGGRIAMKYGSLGGMTQETLKSKMEAVGYSSAGAGTIYLEDTTSGGNMLLIKGLGYSSFNPTGVGKGYDDYLFDEIEVIDGARLSRQSTENIYGTLCTTGGTPQGVIDNDIVCSGIPGFVYYDLGVKLSKFDRIERKYAFIIYDEPEDGNSLFIKSSTGTLIGNGVISTKLKLFDIGNYEVRFYLYNGTGSDAGILKSAQKQFNVGN